MKVILESIDHKDQRYETAGDWIVDEKGDIGVKVSKTGSDDYDFLLALHELIEAKLCQKRGIEEAKVTDFDVSYEKARKDYPGIIGDSEPGDHRNAPYFNEHQFASRIEHSVAQEMGVDWQAYTEAVNKLE